MTPSRRCYNRTCELVDLEGFLVDSPDFSPMRDALTTLALTPSATTLPTAVFAYNSWIAVRNVYFAAVRAICAQGVGSIRHGDMSGG